MNPSTIPGFFPVNAPKSKERVLAGPMGEVCHTVFTQPAELPNPKIELLCFGADRTPLWCDRLCVSILKEVDSVTGNADFKFYWAEDRELALMPPTCSILCTIKTSDRNVHTKEIWVTRNTNFDWLRLSHPAVSAAHGVVKQLGFPSRSSWYDTVGALARAQDIAAGNILQDLGVLDNSGNLLIGSNGRIVLNTSSYMVQVYDTVNAVWATIQEVDF